MVSNAQWLKEVQDFCQHKLSKKYASIFKEAVVYPDSQTLCLKLSALHKLPPNCIPYLEGPKDMKRIAEEARHVCEETGLELLDASNGSLYQNEKIGYLRQLGTLAIGKREIQKIDISVTQIFWAYSNLESRLERQPQRKQLLA